jgi:hypothetical protein
MNSAEYLKRLREQQAAIERGMLERESVRLAAVPRTALPAGSPARTPPPRPFWRRLGVVPLIAIAVALFGGAVALLLHKVSVDDTVVYQARPERSAPAINSQSQAPDLGIDATAGPRLESPPAVTVPGPERPHAFTAGREPGKREDRSRAGPPRRAERLPARSESIPITHQSP